MTRKLPLSGGRGPGFATFFALLLRVVGAAGDDPATPTATATPATPASLSDQLFYEGNTLMTQGKVAEACAKFERSLEILRRGGTLLNLALCRETAGDLAAALPLFEEAQRMAERDGRAARADAAREHTANLRKRLAWITVTVPGEAALPALEIRLDDALLPAEKWAIPVPFAPGEHVHSATAPGRQRFELRVTDAKAGEALAVELPVLQPALETPRVHAPPPLEPSLGEGRPGTRASFPDAGGGESLSHKRQIGVLARLDVDPMHGARAVVGPTVGLGDHVTTGVSALLGPDLGVEPQLTLYFLDSTAVKPFINVGAPIFFSDGVQLGGRAAAGLQWDMNRHFGVFGQVGGAYFPGAPAGVVQGVLLLGVGVEGRL